MVISKDSWHYKMYSWNRHMVEQPVKSQINLCPYMRTVLVWTPLLWLLFAGKIVPRLYNGFLWLILGVSIGGYQLFHHNRPGFYAVLIFIAIAATIVLTVAGIGYLMESGGKHKITNSATYQLVTGYADAVHNKICPLIEVEKDQYPWEAV